MNDKNKGFNLFKMFTGAPKVEQDPRLAGINPQVVKMWEALFDKETSYDTEPLEELKSDITAFFTDTRPTPPKRVTEGTPKKTVVEKVVLENGKTRTITLEVYETESGEGFDIKVEEA